MGPHTPQLTQNWVMGRSDGLYAKERRHTIARLAMGQLIHFTHESQSIHFTNDDCLPPVTVKPTSSTNGGSPLMPSLASIGGLGLLGWRRKRKVKAIAA
jgi:hypothetical protein